VLCPEWQSETSKKKIIISANVIFLFIKTKIKKTTTTPHFVKIREIALKYRSFWYFSVSVSTRLCELFDGYDIQKQPKSQWIEARLNVMLYFNGIILVPGWHEWSPILPEQQLSSVRGWLCHSGGKNPQRQSNGSLRATRRSQECQVCSLASGMQAHSLLWTTSPPLCQQSCGKL